MNKPKSTDKKPGSRKTSVETKGRDSSSRGARATAYKDTKASTPTMMSNGGIRSQLSALFQSNLANYSNVKQKIEKNVNNKSNIIQQTKWLESGYLEQPSILDFTPANKLIKAKRKKTVTGTQKVNLKNIVLPVTNINEVNQTINLKQEYFLPIYNSSPNEMKAKMAYHNPKSTLFAKQKRREKSFSNVSSQSRAVVDPHGSLDDKNIKTGNNTGRSDAVQNRLTKKKSYSFHKLTENRE